VWVGWSKPSVRRLVALVQLLSGSAGLCAVPTGGSEDPCSIVTGGIISCPITLPDFNPADWTSWFGCQIVTFFTNDLAAYAADIWAAIVGDVLNTIGSFFISIENGLNSAVTLVFVDPIQAVLGVLTLTVDDMVSIVTTFLNTFNATLSGTFGAFAPVVAISVFLLVIVALVVGVYYLSLVAWAVGKTLFNLL
jgi:hypothetical protein